MAITIDQAVDNYLTDLALEGKSPETTLWHRKKLSAFCQFLQNGGEPLRVSDLTLENGRAFVKWLMDRKTRYGEHVIRKEWASPRVERSSVTAITFDRSL